MNVRLWLSTAQAADHAGHHVVTIRKALEAGDLHGSQRIKDGKPIPNGRWRIHVDCLDAWLLGEKCKHQEGAAA